MEVMRIGERVGFDLLEAQIPLLRRPWKTPGISPPMSCFPRNACSFSNGPIAWLGADSGSASSLAFSAQDLLPT